jgi:nucleoside-diphosphate-sugar epimerase
MIEDNLPLPARLAAFYRDTPVLVTGGLGFIGSNLALRLHALGARVTVLDNLNPGQGGNHHNLEAIAGDIEIVVADQAERAVVDTLARDQEVTWGSACQRHGPTGAAGGDARAQPRRQGCVCRHSQPVRPHPDAAGA